MKNYYHLLKSLLLCLIPLLLLLVLAACGKTSVPADRYTKYDKMLDYSKPLAFGEDEDVYVLCGKENWTALEATLRATIERTVSLVYPEKYFNLIPVEIKDVASYLPYKNLIFVGDLASADEVSAYMRSSLAKDYIVRVRQTGGDLFIAKNHNSRDQIVLYLLGKDSQSLIDITRLQENSIFSLLLKRLTERKAYQAFRGKIIPPKFWKPYPFSMKVPDTFRLYSNDVKGRFLSLLYRARIPDRSIPDKYISVYYEDMPVNKVDADWAFNKRLEIWKTHFDGDLIRKDKLRSEKFKFAGFEGYRLIGSWENQKMLIGGAFQTMVFWHEKTKRAYLVDNMVFFPAGEKLPLLLELHAISSTLEIN
ncbi:MAG TPA: DUF4837 family protein [Candidatus Cloacimonadota bacterium]|nr:DUF4837 family protein [Candidatus Cloacimonadota bacterium]